MKMQRVKKLTKMLGSALVACLSVTATSEALTWQNPWTPDSNTLVLYHFDETSGTTINDSAGTPTNTTTTASLFTSESSGHWLASGAGNYLRDVNPNGRVANFNVSNIDWSKGLTINF